MLVRNLPEFCQLNVGDLSMRNVFYLIELVLLLFVLTSCASIIYDYNYDGDQSMNDSMRNEYGDPFSVFESMR